MPLGSAGRAVKSEMESRYGAKKGQQVFYAKENKDPKFAKAMKGPTSRKMSAGRR